MTSIWHAIRWTWTGGYNPVSGPIADLGMITAILIWVRHRNCHVKSCWRIRTHDVIGTPYRACRQHHPTVPRDHITTAHIHNAHHEHGQRHPKQQQLTIRPRS